MVAGAENGVLGKLRALRLHFSTMGRERALQPVLPLWRYDLASALVCHCDRAEGPGMASAGDPAGTSNGFDCHIGEGHWSWRTGPCL